MLAASPPIALRTRTGRSAHWLAAPRRRVAAAGVASLAAEEASNVSGVTVAGDLANAPQERGA